MIKHQLKLTLFVLFLLAGCNTTRDDYVPHMLSLNALDALKLHIRSMDDINQINNAGVSLLHRAAAYDRPEAAELILKLGADVNVKGAGGLTPLFHTHSIPMLNTLKKYHINIHAVSDLGLNALNYIYNAETIEALIKDGLDPTLKTKDGKQSALSIAMDQLKAYKNTSAATEGESNIKAQQKNIAIFEVKIAILQKHANFKSSPEIILLARKGNLPAIKKLDKKVNVITSTDYIGNTALHIAATNNQLTIVKYLSKNKKLLSIKNKNGLTALDQVIASKSDSAKYLSCKTNKYCNTPERFTNRLTLACASNQTASVCEKMIRKDIHGAFITPLLMARANKIRFNNACTKFNYIKCTRLKLSIDDPAYAQRITNSIQLHSPSINKKYITSCSASSKKSRCLSFIKTYPGFKAKSESDYALLLLSQTCRIKETGWLYKSKPCKTGYAHGRGEGVNQNKKLSYIGQFSNGQRIKGKIYYDSKPMYDGEFKDGKPNGIGVCFHGNEPEECKYYAGKRIDSLYKQRIAMVKQQQIMDTKLEQMQAAQNKQLMQMQKRMGQHSGGANSAVKSVGDVIIDKAMDKAVDKLFDRLF